MNTNSDGEPSSLFKLFTARTVFKENGIIDRETKNVKTVSSIKSYYNDFDDCSQLPDGLKNCIATKLIGKPLDDPFNENKDTFIVVNKNKQLFRFSSTNALAIFSPTSTIRSNAIRISTHPFYEIFMVIVILAFCLMNASTQPSLFDLRYFLIIFLLESILKIISHGLLFSPFSYLRNGWNIFDVVLNILLFCGTSYLAELRILKIICYSLNLRKTIRIYWSSCKLLRDFIIYMSLIVLILSTLLLHMYMGIFTRGCIKKDSVLESSEYVRLCGNVTGAQTCPESYECREGVNLSSDYGYTNFNSISFSILSTLRLITRDKWENLLHDVVATAGPWQILCFIGIIFIVSYQILSLIWGQIALSYNYIRLQRWEQSLIADDIAAEDVNPQETNKDNAGCWSKFQRFFFFLIYNPYIVLLVIICIILNTLCMAMDHHNMPIELDGILRFANYTFVLIFIVEAILKLLALGVVRYFKDKWNMFDFIVTVIGAVEICLEGLQGLSVLRAFRMLRPLRLGKAVPAFDSILKRMRHLFCAGLGQNIVLVMTIYIFVVFGCQHFGPDNLKFKYDVDLTIERPLWHFSDIMHSFMVVFRAICGEWIDTMLLCLLLSSTSQSLYITVYYLILVTVSSFQIMHIFTALLFANDDSAAISKKKKKKKNQKTLRKNAVRKEKFQLERFLKEKLLEPSIQQIFDEYRPKNDIESNGDRPSTKMVTEAVVIEDDFDEAINNTVSDASIPIESTTKNQQEINENKYFKICLTLCVIAASSNLAFVYSINSSVNSETFEILTISLYVEYLLIGLLTTEVVTKSISRGWKLCMTDAWYWVDVINVITTILGLLLQSTTLQLFTSLRPLSLVSRCRGLNIIANAILKQMWFLTNTLFVCLAFWLVFGILGVQLFAGKFYACVDDAGVRVETLHDRSACIDDNYIWANSFMNFDDIVESFYSLLHVSTFEGWLSIVDDAVDSTEVDRQPMKEANIYVFFYFVIFIVCGVFVCLNVIVGMLVQHMNHFGSLTELLDRTEAIVRDSDRTFCNDDTSNPSKSKFIQFVRSDAFEKIAFVSYVVYIVALTLDHYQSTVQFETVFEYILMVLSIPLIIEVILRGCAYRKEFFASFWNRFDLVFLMFMILEFIVDEIGAGQRYFFSILIFLRMVRIFRFNALVASASRTLQKCGRVIARTWLTVSTLYLFLFVIICVYSLFGMVLYRDTKIEFDSADIINFETFGQSIVLMIQLSTGAGWDSVIKQISVTNPGVAALYMLSFLYISFTILLNVMLVIAFEFHKEVTSIEDDRKQIPTDDLNDFNDKWKRFAQNDQKCVHKNRLEDLFNSLDETSTLRDVKFDLEELELLGVNTRNDEFCGRSTLLIALNRIRLSKLQS